MRTAHTRPDSTQPATTSEPGPAAGPLGHAMRGREAGERVAPRSAGAVLGLAADRVDRRQLTAGICHAPWLLIEARAVPGRTAPCLSPGADLPNAGANRVNREASPDGPILTGARLADLRACCAKLIEQLNSGHS